MYLSKDIQGVFLTGTPPKSSKNTKKLILAGLGVSKPIYVNVDSPNLGFPYFNFVGGYQLKKYPVFGLVQVGATCLTRLTIIVLGQRNNMD